MNEVFVSYKREDEPRVARLVRALEGARFSVWWDRGLPGGESWRAQIEAALDAAKCVVVVWSRDSVGPAGNVGGARHLSRATHLGPLPRPRPLGPPLATAPRLSLGVGASGKGPRALGPVGPEPAARARQADADASARRVLPGRPRAGSCRSTTKTNSRRKVRGGTRKKSTATVSRRCAWRKARQVGDGQGEVRRCMYFATVSSATAYPNKASSAWTRRRPQVGLSRAM
jgi:TIR domain